MVMVWLEGGQGEVSGACPPHHPKLPHLPPPPPHHPSLDPPSRGLRPTSTGGWGVTYKSEETPPPCSACVTQGGMWSCL